MVDTLVPFYVSILLTELARDGTDVESHFANAIRLVIYGSAYKDVSDNRHHIFEGARAF